MYSVRSNILKNVIRLFVFGRTVSGCGSRCNWSPTKTLHTALTRYKNYTELSIGVCIMQMKMQSRLRELDCDIYSTEIFTAQFFLKTLYRHLQCKICKVSCSVAFS